MVSRRDRGFTLIELLVVIGIIALLVAVMLPALSAARQAGISAECRSNLRMIGISNTLYAADWKDRHVGYSSGTDRKVLLYPYTMSGKSNAQVDIEQLWNCDAIEFPGEQAGYGFNTKLNFQRLSIIAEPAATVDVGDAGINDALRPILSTHMYPPSSQTDGATGLALTIGRPNPRHQGKVVNVTFVDAHVEALPMSPPFYPDEPGAWFGNNITSITDANYKDQLWDLN